MKTSPTPFTRSFKSVRPRSVMLVVSISLIAALISCSSSPVYESPAGYDLTNPERTLLKESLIEISGVTFSGSTDSAFAINDEQAKLFYFHLGDEKTNSVRFGKAGDYEDVSLNGKTVFVLRSDGTLYSFSADSLNEKDVEPHVIKNAFEKGEYESMYIKSDEHRLIVLCKDCKKEKKHIVSYQATLVRDSITEVKKFFIDTESLNETYNLKFGFRPSALTWNDKTHEWFIISAVNQLLLITDNNWVTRAVYELDPKLFTQPEGMAFDHEYNLYISNEGNEIHNGNILKFKFQL